MHILPAIDLRGAQVVRLFQGDYDQMTVYNADPCAVAREFVEKGATNLHVVDLDGAKDGTLSNFETIRNLCQIGGLDIEVGGGIRDENRIKTYLDLGVRRVILGTVAVQDFDFTARMGQLYGDKIAVGVDTKDGYIATHGWKEVSSLKGEDFCKKLLEVGISTVIYTDIACDGAQKGTNLALYQRLTQIPGLKVIASGGVGSVAELKTLQDYGCYGAILGKALYAGTLDLKDAIEAMNA